MNMKKYFRYLGLLALPVLINGCYVYSAFQSAKTLDKGEISITPALSILSYNSDSVSGHASTNFGLQAAYGLSKHINISGRYEKLNSGKYGYHYCDMAIKVGLIPSMLSISLPAGIYFGESVKESGSIHVQPTLLATYSVNDVLDLNISLKDVLFINDNYDNLIAGNAGVGFNTKVDEQVVTILPEIGILMDPQESGYFFNYGIGFGIKF